MPTVYEIDCNVGFAYADIHVLQNVWETNLVQYLINIKCVVVNAWTYL